LTDVAGLHRDWPAATDVVSEITADDLERLLPELSAGMAPKMEACLRAVRDGVPQVHVLDGRLEHALLLEIFTSEGIGTMVRTGAEPAGGPRWGGAGPRAGPPQGGAGPWACPPRGRVQSYTRRVGHEC